MRVTRRLVSLFALATLVALPASLPALAQSGSAERVTHRQSVLTEMSPEGEAGTSRVFTQLTVVGDGEVELALPNQSTSGLRNLDSFGRPAVEGDQVVYSVAATRDGTAERTVADNTAELPIELSIAYELDGEPIEPRDLVGKTGDLTATFTVRNTTAVPTEVQFFDGRQNPQRETIDVAVPMVGSLSMNLDGRFVDIDAPAASVAGDGRGNTTISWSLVLFEPIGAEEQTVSYTAHVTDAIVPEMVGQFLPVDSTSFSSLKSVQETFGDVAEGLSSLTTGALIVDGNVKLLADGAGQLLDGLGQLSDGADQLSAGLNERAAPGSRQLAEGMGAARAGGRQLADGLNTAAVPGARELASGLGGSAAPGARQINDGINGLRGGIGTGSDTAANGTVIGGLNSLYAGLSQDILEGIGAVREQQTNTQGCAFTGPEGVARCGMKQIGERMAGALGGLTTTLGTELSKALTANLQDALGENLGAGMTEPLGDALADALEDAIAANMEEPLSDALEDAIAANMVKPLSDALQGAIAANMEKPLSDALQGAIAANMEKPLSDALQGAIAENLTAGLATSLAGALQAAPPNGLGLDEATATAFATAFAGQFAPTFAAQLAPTFAAQFAPTFAAQLAPTFAAQFAPTFAAQFAPTFAAQFAAGFAEQLAPQFAAGFAPGFAAQFAPAFAAGFAPAFGEQFGPGFAAVFAPQFGAAFGPGFADGFGGAAFDPLAGLSGAIVLKADGSAKGLTQISNGITQEVLPGIQKLLAGMNNPNCDRANPTNRANPCGVKQVLELLSAGSGELAVGLVTAATGAGDLADGLATAGSGANDLANGLVQLDDGANELASGLGDAADGSVQLAEGLDSAEEGGEKIADGTQALTDRGMSQIIDGASEGAMTPALAVAHAKAADARGKAGEGLPYGTVDGAEASAVYKFEIAGYGGPDEGPSTPVRAAATIAAFGIAGALGLGLRRTLV
jgi:putative membrane protein